MATIGGQERLPGYSRGMKQRSRLGWFTFPLVAVSLLVFVFVYTLPAGWKTAAGMTGASACVIVGACVVGATIRCLIGILAEVEHAEKDRH